MQNTRNELQYRQEHLMCKNYVADECANWGVWHLNANRLFVKECLKRPTLVFVLKGEMNISTVNPIGQKVVAGQMFLVPTGESFYGKAVCDTSFIRCSFTRELALCNRFSIEQLQDCIDADYPQDHSIIPLLPIRPLLYKELEITRDVLETGLACIHYQRMKMEILFMELRGFYKREELALLFAPILGKDNDFKDKVLQIYPEVNTAKELISQLNMSPTGFKRKFQESFGTSAKQWLIQKKKEKLLRDIIMTNMSIAELADKYRFSVNYLTTFCKEHFGKSPTELRSDGFPIKINDLET